MADVLADEVVAGDRDEMPAPHVAEPVEDLGHAHGDRRLARPGVAGEAHVQGRRLRRKPEFGPNPVDEQQRRDLADALLDWRETDQLVVELLQNRADARLRELLGKIDSRRLRGLGSALLVHAYRFPSGLSVA